MDSRQVQKTESEMQLSDNLVKLQELGQSLAREWHDMKATVDRLSREHAELSNTLESARKALLADDTSGLYEIIRGAKHAGPA